MTFPANAKGRLLLLTRALCLVLVVGCSETGDGGYRVSSNSRSAPTLHLVVDRTQFSGIPESNHRRVEIAYHVQSNRPVEKDTFVFVREFRGSAFKQGGFSKLDKLVVILAGRTQSRGLGMSDDNYVDSMPFGFNDEEYTPIVEAELPEAHERAGLLPTSVSYRNAANERQETDLLVEYPFNPYKVGSPRNISLKWQANQ